MRNYKDIVEAQIKFKERQEQFLNLNCEFFLLLFDKMIKETALPKGTLLTYKSRLDIHTNIAEDWFSLDDKSNYIMKINLNFNNTSHIVDFKMKKIGNTLNLGVFVNSYTETFSFEIMDNVKLESLNLDYEKVINFIFDSIKKTYDIWFN